MKSVIKALTLTLALAAAVFFTVSGLDAQEATPAIPDSAEYPVLLVHGLGGGPGEATFGEFETLLEAFFFDVEVMDFDETRIPALNNHKATDNLPALAAVLGRKVKDMLKQYDVDKINIVAHSFGGLIVQAYILDRGAELDKQFGLFEFDIDKVVYLATPFYGVRADDALLQQLVNDTDYGPYTRIAQMINTLEPGSNDLFGLDATLRSVNPYAFDVDILTIVSDDDEVVSARSGTLGHYTGRFKQHFRYRNLNGYNHAFHPASGGDRPNRQSLAYVDSISDDVFAGVVSFLDDGITWRKIRHNLPTDGMVMVSHNGKGLSGDEATLTFRKKLKGVTKGKRIAAGETVEPYFNENSNVFVFTGLANGEYDLLVTHGNKSTTERIEVKSEGKDMSIPAFVYNFRKNELAVGDGSTGKLNGVYTLAELTYTSKNKEHRSDKINGLDTSGFEITCFIEGAERDVFDKGRVFVIYNQSGSSARSWNGNGGRLDVQIRGHHNAIDDLRHAGKAALLATVDFNENGLLEHNLVEDYEVKSVQRFDWRDAHRLRVRVEYFPNQNQTVFKYWVDNIEVASFDLRGQYYNPNPVISFGGRRFDENYFSPKGLTITNLVIKNLDN